MHQLPAGQKIYFASDFHLGVPDYKCSRERENTIVRWLSTIEHDAAELFLLGDLFDFWFEYRHVVPKGNIRLLGKIASFTDRGIPVHIHVGNHDMWMFGYLEKELGVTIHYHPETRYWNGLTFLIGHGDGLGPGDYGYKFIKKIFRNRIFQWSFARLHPNLAFVVANYFSKQSRKANYTADAQYLGDENEWLVQYCKQQVKTQAYNYMIFGHRHLPLQKNIAPNCMYINLGDWIQYNTYAVFDGKNVSLQTFA